MFAFFYKNKTKNFMEVSKEYMECRKRDLRASSYASYKHLLEKKILPLLGEKEIQKIGINDLQLFVNEMQNCGYSKHGTRDCVSIIKLVMKYGESLGYCKHISGDVKYKKEIKLKKDNLFTDEEYEKLLKYCVENPSKRTIPTLISMTTGLRIGEVCALKYSDINFKKNTLSVSRSVKRINIPGESSFLEVSDPKTISSNRIVPIIPELSEILERSCNDLECFISSGEKDKPLEPRSYRVKYERILRKLEIEHHTFHDLRHTFASRCINSGADARAVADILGHKNVDMTLNVYTHSTEKHRMNVAYNAVKMHEQ